MGGPPRGPPAPLLRSVRGHLGGPHRSTLFGGPPMRFLREALKEPPAVPSLGAPRDSLAGTLGGPQGAPLPPRGALKRGPQRQLGAPGAPGETLLGAFLKAPLEGPLGAPLGSLGAPLGPPRAPRAVGAFRSIGFWRRREAELLLLLQQQQQEAAKQLAAGSLWHIWNPPGVVFTSRR
ncbi:hypothetical protein ETH_00040590 [Eimeria tenella]|uniref:Uncharacterized protein n=1 Tax=Eimeria tenella TaxID=5802 RepID=U6L4P7_EIMTE|nr:hypothetical protein ETH_00040590 [Eimeria tenella]CDJ44183.1 hypothetical protein ETH_00040590 [Eimeria tenella]|eukprot:XP_013234932.1 hypothetical protein ETH_00040590 [Eimeria tenella]